MANFASIKIVFQSVPLAGDDEIIIGFNDGILTDIEETPVNVRGGSKQFSISPDQFITAESLAYAINKDYGIGGLVASLPISANSDINDDVLIEALEYGVVFTGVDIPLWATVEITPEVQPPSELAIGEITVFEADGVDKCGTCRYDFTVENATGATLPITITSPVSKVAATANDLFFDYDRNHVPQATLEIISDDSEVASAPLSLVTVYSFDSVTVQESFSGATIVLNASKEVKDVDITFTYSIDDVSYGVSNVFYSVAPGSYTAYVLDNLGCKKSLPFEVVGVSVNKPEPIFRIQNANSIKFYESTVFSACGEIPNFDNAPVIDQGYFNIEKQNYQQLVQQCDNTTVQIQTNYEIVLADVVNCDNEVVQSPVVSTKVENILQRDKRDCQLKAGESGKTNIYYVSGSVYDPGTLNIIGTYQLSNGLLPEFASDGNIASGITISLSGTTLNGAFTVQRSVYDEEINGYALEINAIFTGVTGEAAITDSTYNDEDYNVLEFVIDWATIDEGNYKVMTTGTDTDPRYDPVLWPSEEILNLEIQSDHAVIKYSNPDNIAQINYTTGIEFTLRVPARFIKDRDGGETENFVSDDQTREQLKGTVSTEIELESDLIPQYIKQKLSIASIHKNLDIDGQASVYVEKAEQSDLFENNNPFYTFNAWYQVGDSIDISDGSGIVSGTGRVLGVNANVLGV